MRWRTVDQGMHELLHNLEFLRLCQKRSWRDGTSGKPLALHVANPSLIPGTPGGPMSLPIIII